MLRHLEIRAGVVLDDTPYASQGYAIASDKIRWVEGKAESMGGYQDMAPGHRIRGIARSAFDWTTVRGVGLRAFGSSDGLFVQHEDRLHDVTPLLAERQGTISGGVVTSPGHGLRPGQRIHVSGSGIGGDVAVGQNPFLVAVDRSDVLVRKTGHGLTANALVRISGSDPVSGETMNGLRTASVAGPDTFVLHLDDHSEVTGTVGGTPTIVAFRALEVGTVLGDTFTLVGATGNGPVSIVPELMKGRTEGALPGGYGQGPYSVGPFGADAGAKSRAVYLPRTWTLDQYGEDLLANPIGGGLYHWRPNLSKRAVIVAAAPAQIDTILVTPERVVLALGCTHTDGTYDPMAIRWCSLPQQGGIDAWFPSATNVAGDDRLGVGSNIIRAIAGTNSISVWTDTSVYRGTAVGGIDQFYRFDLVADSCGLIAPNAVVSDPAGEAWWMGENDVIFNMKGGAPEIVECPVTSWLDYDSVQANKNFAVLDAAFSAVMFFIPGRYIRLDTKERSRDGRSGWSVGTTDMTCWLDAGVARHPVSVREDGMVCGQDLGLSANGAAMTRFVEYAPLELSGGETGAGEFVLNCNRVVLDAKIVGTLKASLRYKRWPDEITKMKGPWALTSAKVRFDPRVQARQLGLHLQSDGVADAWRIGLPRIDVSQGPRR